jgi:hypothetical protein
LLTTGDAATILKPSNRTKEYEFRARVIRVTEGGAEVNPCFEADVITSVEAVRVDKEVHSDFVGFVPNL